MADASSECESFLPARLSHWLCGRLGLCVSNIRSCHLRRYGLSSRNSSRATAQTSRPSKAASRMFCTNLRLVLSNCISMTKVRPATSCRSNAERGRLRQINRRRPLGVPRVLIAGPGRSNICFERSFLCLGRHRRPHAGRLVVTGAKIPGYSRAQRAERRPTRQELGHDWS